MIVNSRSAGSSSLLGCDWERERKNRESQYQWFFHGKRKPACAKDTTKSTAVGGPQRDDAGAKEFPLPHPAPPVRRSPQADSEGKVSTQLYDAHVGVKAGGVGDGPGGGIGQNTFVVANICIRVGVVDMVEHIIHVSPDFESHLFAWKSKGLSDTEVGVEEAGPGQGVAAGRS